LVKSWSTPFPVLLNRVNHSGSIEKRFMPSGRKFSLEKLKWLCLIRDLSHTDRGYPCLFDLPRFVIRGRSGSCEIIYDCERRSYSLIVSVLCLCCQLKISKNALSCVL
jgi:hypothetical protein